MMILALEDPYCDRTPERFSDLWKLCPSIEGSKSEDDLADDPRS